MKIQILEDDVDYFSMLQKQFGNHEDIELFHSSTLEELCRNAENSQVDFTLIDVNRPDAISLSDDLDKIKKFTNAPIFFVTGSGADGLRPLAIEAGAGGVIEKDSISPSLIKQFYLNYKDYVIDDGSESDSADFDRDPPEKLLDSLSRLSGPLSYLRLSIERLLEAKSNRNEKITYEFLYHILEVVEGLQEYSESDRGLSITMPISRIFDELLPYFSDFAKVHKVAVTFSSQPADCHHVGSLATARLGIKLLMDAFILANKGGSLHIDIRKDGDGARLTAYSDQSFLSSSKIFQPGKNDFISSDNIVKYDLELAGLLLNLRNEQACLKDSNSSQILSIVI